MKVLFTPSARAQFLAALAHIRRENPSAARRLRERAERKLRRLGRFPRSGHALAEFPDLPFREIAVAPYRFFYAVKNKGVWVVAVWPGAQLPEPPQG